MGAVACSSVKPEQIDANADVQSELAKTEGNLANARAEQVDVLAPTGFENANREFKAAKEARDDGADAEKVFSRLGRSRAFLKKANESAALTKTGLVETQKARAAALAAGAGQHREKEFASLDQTLKNVTESAESGNVERIREHDKMLSDKYYKLELESIKEANLGPALSQIKQADREDAKKWSPKTLDQVNEQYKALDEFITANPHDPSIAQKASELNAASTRLVNITREAKKFEKTDAESLVLEREKNEQTLAEREQALAAEKQRLAVTSSALATTEQQARTYEQQQAFERKFEESRVMFSPNEAEVYRQADSLTIRLKALAFKTGGAGLGSDNYGVLKKVEAVIKKFDAPRIVVEGHTDSTGSKQKNLELSQARAEAVANYLVAQGVPQASISTVGYGPDKPIANNKTKEGRTQNRRVDVIIDSRRESVSL